MKVLFTLRFFLLFSLLIPSAFALEKTNRLGLGLSNQLKTEYPALSFKMQKSRSFAVGGMLGFSSDKNEGGQAAALKFYRNIFDEPQLNFYFAGTGAYLNNKLNGKRHSGFQFDLSLGSEFHFSGLNSIGFSFEFGVSANKKYNDFVFETLGNHFIVSGVHFYL